MKLKILGMVFFGLAIFSGPLASSAQATETLSFLHQDHLGSTNLVTNENREVVFQQNYYPYGTTRASQGDLAGERAYTGQASDQEETELYYYQARYYSPQTARFTQPDNAEGPNRYLYANANPAKYIDPSGTQTEDFDYFLRTLCRRTGLCCEEGPGFSTAGQIGFVSAAMIMQTATARAPATSTPTATATVTATSTPKPAATARPPLANKAFSIKGYHPSKLRDLDLSRMAYEPIPRVVGYDYPYIGDDTYSHAIDRAPQMKTLVGGMPPIVETYRITGADLPADLHGREFANLVAFRTGNNPLRLPQYAQDIGEGYGALVLYADNNSLTLKYTAEDSIVYGYTLHLEGIKVEPSILNDYRRLNSAGRLRLPALHWGQNLGVAANGTIMIAIRDTGMFMDPRWISDWWR